MVDVLLTIIVILCFLLILVLRKVGKKPWSDTVKGSDTSKRTFLLFGLIIILLVVKLIREC